MIKRQYFIKTEVRIKNRLCHSYRQFYYTSWLNTPADALEYRLELLAAGLNVNIDDIVVTAFNRV